jgi:hypothetical protein
MPAGPAAGRVEAQRRALTTTSTAPASESRWCDDWIWIWKDDVSAGKTCDAHNRILLRFVGRFLLKNLDTKMCPRAARLSCTT